MKPRIAIFFTGGTISMRVDPKTGGPVPALSGDEIIAQTQGLSELADIAATDFALLPGWQMTPPQMLALARTVAEQLADERVNGVVVTHGTDTLEETAYLHDLVLDSDKPVVFVGAMRNSSELSWDGPANLRLAVRVAADPSARGLGVVVVMANQIIAAAEATKTHTAALDTFQSRDFGPLGLVDHDRVIIAHHRAQREHIRADTLEEGVEIIKLSAGSDGRFIRFALENGAKGLAIEGLGRGNVPLTVLEDISRAIQTGIPVVITSRCFHGRVLDVYASAGSGGQLKRMGAILGGMLPSHKARLKLMLLLGARADLKTIRESFESGG